MMKAQQDNIKLFLSIVGKKVLVFLSIVFYDYIKKI